MESTRRLHQAYKSDRYIKDIQKRMSDFMAYQCMPFQNELPKEIKVYQQMIEHYTKDQYPWLLGAYEHNMSDIALSFGYALFAAKEQKLLSTKKESPVSVLDGIDIRLTLYTIYQKEWISRTSWEIMHPKDIYLKLMFGSYPEPYMSFNEWLYRHGYEYLLNNSEFLAAIDELDNYSKNS